MSEALPLLPLSGVFLFPESVLPVRLRHPGLGRLMEDLVRDRGADLVVATLEPTSDPDPATSPVHPLAGLGRLRKAVRRSDGDWNLVVEGRSRARILEELPSGDQGYRRVVVMPLPEPEPPRELREELCPALRDALESRAGIELPYSHDCSPGHLADMLVLHLPLDFEGRRRLFTIVDPETRARRALSTHDRLPPTAGRGPSGTDPDRTGLN